MAYNPKFQENFNRQKRYLPQVESIIRRNAYYMISIDPPTEVQDTKQSTDMVLRVTAGINVAVRVRTPDNDPNRKQTGKVLRDLTIRSTSHSGGKTELQKLREGFGDWYVYAWSSSNDVIDEWILVNIHVLRSSGLLARNRFEIPNKGDNTKFVAISLREMFVAKALVAGVILQDDGYWNHFICREYGRVWEAGAYSVLDALKYRAA